MHEGPNAYSHFLGKGVFWPYIVWGGGGESREKPEKGVCVFFFFFFVCLFFGGVIANGNNLITEIGDTPGGGWDTPERKFRAENGGRSLARHIPNMH